MKLAINSMDEGEKRLLKELLQLYYQDSHEQVYQKILNAKSGQLTQKTYPDGQLYCGKVENQYKVWME